MCVREGGRERGRESVCERGREGEGELEMTVEQKS